MNANDRVAAERQHVLSFALAGGVVLLLAVFVALSSAVTRTAGTGRAARCWMN